MAITDPTDITGLAEWWDPDDISGSHGDAITTWTGNNAIALSGTPGGDPPTLVGATRQPSGHQMALISQVDHRLTVTNAAFDIAQPTYAFVYLPLGFGHIDVDGGVWVFNKQNTNAATISLRYTDAESGQYSCLFRLDGSEGTVRTATATGYNQRAVPHVIVLRYDGSEMIMRVNGVEVGSLTISGNLDADNTNPLVLGNHPTADRDHAGMFGDFIVYDNAISDADMQDLEAWLTTRWNINDYWDDWATLPATSEATPSAGEDELFSPCIRELDANTWIMFACIEDSGSSSMRWVDYWTAPKSDPHNWSRNGGGPIIDATTDSPTTCRGVSAVLDGSTWHILVDDTGDFHHFTGTNLAALTDNGQVFAGTGTGWEQFVRHPYIATTKVGSDWAVYYDGRQGSATAENGAIGVVYTSDFVSFTSRQQVLTSSDLWWEDSDVGAPAVWYRNGQWEMVYSGFSTGLGTTEFPHWFGLATSPDGVTWTKLSQQVPILAPFRDGVIEDRINQPELFHDGSNVYVYFGNINPGRAIMSSQVGAAYLAATAMGQAGVEILLLGVPL